MNHLSEFWYTGAAGYLSCIIWRTKIILVSSKSVLNRQMFKLEKKREHQEPSRKYMFLNFFLHFASFITSVFLTKFTQLFPTVCYIYLLVQPIQLQCIKWIKANRLHPTVAYRNYAMIRNIYGAICDVNIAISVIQKNTLTNQHCIMSLSKSKISRL